MPSKSKPEDKREPEVQEADLSINGDDLMTLVETGQIEFPNGSILELDLSEDDRDFNLISLPADDGDHETRAITLPLHYWEALDKFAKRAGNTVSEWLEHYLRFMARK